MNNSDVPKCPLCGSARAMELQIMPQLFDFCKPLKMVDWDTIVIYSCTNLGKCGLAGGANASDSCFIEEFAYVQFSEDCVNWTMSLSSTKGNKD